jgi:hypothetical protein
MINTVDFLPSEVGNADSCDGRFYVLTALDFNHIKRPMNLDGRFFDCTNTEFYFFDSELDLNGFPRPALMEVAVHPKIASAGRLHLAEWSFLLAEYEKGFAKYPFFMTSSRFYEKNKRLRGSLGTYQARLFQFLKKYGYGYLPSYDRNLSFIDLEDYRRLGRLGITDERYDLILKKFGVDMTNEGRWVSDYWCNYIGFGTREHLTRYIEFYLPVLHDFFDSDWSLVNDYREMNLVRLDVPFRNFKPLTLFLEQISHLFFYKNKYPFIGLHYEGFYEINEWRKSFEKLDL